MPNFRALAPALTLALALPASLWAHTDRVTGQDYSGFQRNDGRGSCCDWHDCRPALAPFTDRSGGQKISDLAGNVFFFDPAKIVPRPSDDGNWHVCGDARRVNCIIAPAQSERGSTPLDRLFGKQASPAANEHDGALDDEEIARQLAAAPICRAGVP